MKRWKSIGFSLGLMLLILSAVAGVQALRSLAALRPAEAYTDAGIHWFQPYKVLPIQVRASNGSVKTEYRVYYRDISGSGYQWQERSAARSLGEKTVEEGVLVDRRVLRIPGESLYITVEPDLTAQTYLAGLRGRYQRIAALSAVYVLAYSSGWWVHWLKERRKREALELEDF